MIPKKRHDAILDMLKNQKTISISDITQVLNVSEITARRDLEFLENTTSLLMRIRGGAQLIEKEPETDTVYLNDRFSKQLAKSQQEKFAIGKLAASLVKDDEIILIDAGSTSLQLAKHLNGYKRLNAVVTAVNVAEELEGKEGITTILTGGVFRSRTTTLLSPFIEQSLSSIYANKVFLGVTGVSLSHGFTNSDFFEAEVKKILAKSGQEVYWLADSTKLNFIAPIQISTIEEQHTIITDSGIDDRMKAELEKRCRLLVANKG